MTAAEGEANGDGGGDSVGGQSTPCPEPGLYRHYKGADYRVLGCVRHSESEERLVLYRALYGAGELWVRPLGMFVGDVVVGDRVEPRFRLVEAADGASDETIP